MSENPEMFQSLLNDYEEIRINLERELSAILEIGVKLRRPVTLDRRPDTKINTHGYASSERKKKEGNCP